MCLMTSCGENKTTTNKHKSTPPNIIFILADDLGYGDLSCYGQTLFATPNIDNLAKDGLLFLQHYAGSTVCAPSRSSLITGLHTGHTPIRGNKSTATGQFPLPAKSFTIAELLQNNGYATGAFGKWGLGYSGSEGDPLQQGFDTFFGHHDQRLSHHYYPNYLWDNDKKIILKENQGLGKGQYAPSIIHDKALAFIDTHQEKPFFLFYPTIIPHAELFAPQEYMDKFINQFLPEKKYQGTDDGEQYKKGRYGSQQQSHAAFVAMVTLLDDQVGELVQKVKEQGLEDNTIFIFTSDNGPHKEGGADPDYFNSNANLRGYKRDLYEGGIRVPLIIKWPNKIKAERQTAHLSAFWDFMPTFADILKVDLPEQTDGISFLPTLINQKTQKNHDHLYWEFHEKGGRQALRKDNWKLVKYEVRKNGAYQLYDLDRDPSETKNMATQMPDKVKELAKILESSRTVSEDFKF